MKNRRGEGTKEEGGVIDNRRWRRAAREIARERERGGIRIS